MLEVDQVVKHLPLHTKHQMHVSPMMEYGWGTTLRSTAFTAFDMCDSDHVNLA